MANFMSIGPDLNSLMSEEGPAPLTDAETAAGLSDGGKTGTRTARIVLNHDGSVSSASNTGVTTAVVVGKRSNAGEIAVNGLQIQSDNLQAQLDAGLADGSIAEGSAQHQQLLADMRKLEDQAITHTEQDAHSTAVETVGRSEAQDATARHLNEALELQQEAARDRKDKELERRKRNLMY